MIDPTAAIAIQLFIILLAASTAGLTGFGFALVAVPLLITVLPPKMVIPIVLILTTLGHFVIMYEARKWLDLRRIWPLVLAGILATPLGTYLLVILDVDILKLLIGVVITVSALAFLLGFKRPIRNEKLAFIPVGAASGVLGGSTGMSGPPVILFLSNQGAEKQVFRANLTFYFTVLSLATLPSQYVGGLITRDVVIRVLGFLPVLMLGTFVGIKLAHKVNEELFKRVTLIVVMFAGILSITSAL